MLANRDPADLEGVAVHLYRATESMVDRVFVNADGELLIIPQAGTLRICHRAGPDGGRAGLGRARSRAGCASGSRWTARRAAMSPKITARMFRLPELGPIGSNGLANARDFETPVAAYEDVDRPCEVVQKYLGALWTTTLDH